jgi:hypothetical protein
MMQSDSQIDQMKLASEFMRMLRSSCGGHRAEPLLISGGNNSLNKLIVERELVSCDYYASLPPKMTTNKTATNATQEIAPAKLAHMALLERQRKNAQRTLLKRRRKKAGQ